MKTLTLTDAQNIGNMYYISRPATPVRDAWRHLL